MINVILDWPCRVCGILNRYHEVFQPKSNYYMAQWQLVDAPKLVPQFDHYADPPSTNLEYLEYLYDKKVINNV